MVVLGEVINEAMNIVSIGTIDKHSLAVHLRDQSLHEEAARFGLNASAPAAAVGMADGHVKLDRYV